MRAILLVVSCKVISVIKVLQYLQSCLLFIEIVLPQKRELEEQATFFIHACILNFSMYYFTFWTNVIMNSLNMLSFYVFRSVFHEGKFDG